MAQASAEKLEHTGPAEKERVASVLQRKQLARTSEPPLPKKRNRAVCPRYQTVRGESVKMGKSRNLARERDQRESMGGKGRLHGEGRQVSRK